MKIGLIGLGVVGGTLKRWLEENTKHELALHDPPKGLADNLRNCDAIFISVPVPATVGGQDQHILRQSVVRAKHYTDNVFIRSTVLPGTNDRLETISMPEFLTERRAYEDFCKLPIILGEVKDKNLDLAQIFPGKKIIQLSNVEAELCKYAHNCFGAMKVTYFNIIEEMCRKLGAEFSNVKHGASITGFIEPVHTQVPGPDGKRGYGGKCFPDNVSALKSYLAGELGMVEAGLFFQNIHTLNRQFRQEPTHPHERAEA